VLPDVARWILSHLRKLRAEMIWCSQHEDRVATALRQQTHEMVIVKRKQFRVRSFCATFWEPEKFRKNGQDCLFKENYSLKKSVLRMYNSWDLITPDAHGDEGGIVSELIARLERLGSAPADPVAVTA
jgi:hypothetical protein